MTHVGLGDLPCLATGFDGFGLWGSHGVRIIHAEKQTKNYLFRIHTVRPLQKTRAMGGPGRPTVYEKNQEIAGSSPLAPSTA